MIIQQAIEIIEFLYTEYKKGNKDIIKLLIYFNINVMITKITLLITNN